MTETPTLPVLTLERAVTLLDEIVAEHPPEYTYRDVVAEVVGDVRGSSCMYFTYVDNRADKPLCIVGQVIARVLPDVSMFSDELFLGPNLLEIENAPASDVLYTLRDHDLLGVPEDLVSVLLNEAQARQDTGYPWSHAVAFAKKVALDGIDPLQLAQWFEREGNLDFTA